MYQDSKRTCTAIVLLIKPFVWCRSRCRCRQGLLKLPNDGEDDAKLKLNLYLPAKFAIVRSVLLANGSENVFFGLICNARAQFRMEKRKISPRRSRSSDDAEFGHFTLLFCRGR